MELLSRAVDAVRARTSIVPRVAVVLGSGLGAFAGSLGDAAAIDYGELPGMPRSTIVGHAGRLVIGRAGDVPCVVMQGRVHLYEGHDANVVVHGVRLMRLLGAEVAVVTNAAGGLSPAMSPGDVMVIRDHLNLTGRNPLTGPNLDGLGPRFPDMTAVYDARLSAIARAQGEALGLRVHEGVYAALLGPSYETPAEIRMLATLGASAVGMSTALEAIALRHAGARVVGLSCVTNLAAGLSPTELTHAEVEETARRVRDRFVPWLAAIVQSAGGSA
ncbi:MAG: purine-nucleoside phosphorylase [Deltaproteobacteria bacterium]|nr:purine-nucleoside phosphorylase [Deltaproteobacteria bacterium]